jgi:hypothetical protein
LGLAAIASAGVALFAALQDDLVSPLGLGMSALTLVLALLAWQLRTSPSLVTIEGGVVDIETDGSLHRFDLTNDAVEVRMHGQPGDRDWRVDFVRRSLPPCTVTPRMVNPEEFVSAVRRYRADL